MRVSVALVVGVMLAVWAAVPVSAQGLPRCDPGAVTQYDLAGFYESETMAVSVYPCGGSYLEWRNAYGTHSAMYLTTLHLRDGVIAQGVQSTSGYLDSSVVVGYKAADPGYIQVLTEGPLGSRVYRLRKMY